MKRHLAFSAMCLVLFCGCVIKGDGVVNGTGETVRIVVWTASGAQREEKMEPHASYGERRTSFKDKGRRYQRMSAFDATGKEIGQFDVKQLPKSSKMYGAYLELIVVSDGIFPVPAKYLDRPEEHVNEIKQIFYKECETQLTNP